MINLEEYKNKLINSYRYEIDNNEIKKKERREYLNKKYTDEYLNKIIDDTYSVIRTIFDRVENNYYIIDMDDDTTRYINLNLTGGYFSDRLYVDPYGNIISEYILKKTFGDRLTVVLDIDENDFDTGDEDIMSFDYRYFLYLQGFPKNMKDIKENLFGRSKVKMK